MQSSVMAAALSLFAGLILPHLIDYNKKERSIAYEIILDDEYSLLLELKKYSLAEFEHAKKVSYLSQKCAREIGADELAAACGGLYYRIGKMIGRLEGKHAVNIAIDRSFPPAVIDILYEYLGRLRLPSSPESAIVHMTDALVTKLEVLKDETYGSDWNEDMIIYQTLNEFSNAGTYDKCGMSMNQFLKIREVLVREGVNL